jgi:MFS family permease
MNSQAASAAVSAPLALALWLNAVMLVASLAMLAVPILAPVVFPALDLPVATVGVYAGALWAFALVGSLSAGAFIGRLGAWRTAQVTLLLCAAGLACGATGTAFGIALAALFIGVGNGLETPGASQLLVRGVAPARRPLYFSLKQTGVQIGGLAGALVLPALAVVIGWRASLLALAGLGLLVAASLAPQRRRYADIDPVGQARPLHFAAALSYAWHRPVLRRLALAAAAFGATQICLNSFLVTYAVEERYATLAQAGLLLAAAQSGGLVGRVLWGWVAARGQQAAGVLKWLGIGMSITAAALGAFGARMDVALLLPLAFGFGLTASGWNGVLLAEVAHHVPAEHVAAATGAVLVIMTLGLMAAPPAFALLGAAQDYGSAYIALAAIAMLGVVFLPRGPG